MGDCGTREQTFRLRLVLILLDEAPNLNDSWNVQREAILSPEREQNPPHPYHSSFVSFGGVGAAGKEELNRGFLTPNRPRNASSRGFSDSLDQPSREFGWGRLRLARRDGQSTLSRFSLRGVCRDRINGADESLIISHFGPLGATNDRGLFVISVRVESFEPFAWHDGSLGRQMKKIKKKREAHWASRY